VFVLLIIIEAKRKIETETERKTCSEVKAIKNFVSSRSEAQNFMRTNLNEAKKLVKFSLEHSKRKFRLISLRNVTKS
jgi:hypothetical protein